ncbi:unnamed protein product [Chrysodeixis includens]|uniref:Uncharacterized protein n=1 Tax=Chrysodeixis includens TaxID=689277 RepID=A0A9N8Q207_CHRIL|nr:unnamed protein product [Chrysodeixis includens]
MGTDYQAAKPELLAIYRLEFYKNKKNWKLGKDRKPTPPLQTPKHKSAFNETYDVQLHEELEPEPPLNDAFLHVPPLDDPYPEPYPEPLLVRPAQAPDLVHEAWPAQQWIDPGLEDQQEWCGADAEGVPADVACPELYAPPYAQRLWPPVYILGDAYAAQCSPPRELLALAEHWVQHCEAAPEHDQLAPHSSEIDLSAAGHAQCGCISSQSLRSLGAGAVLRALRSHAAALRLILRELAARHAPPSPYSSPPYEERPTRDTDPPHLHDRLLAASRMPTPTPSPTPDRDPFCDMTPSAGRGRGRGRRVIGLNCAQCGCISSQSLRSLGAGAVLRALRSHAAALRLILRELAARHAPPSPYSSPPYEERPTRDTDPPHLHDRLLAASRMPTPTPTPSPTPDRDPFCDMMPSAGRGRGRGRRVIGLNCGRPYRL